MSDVLKSHNPYSLLCVVRRLQSRTERPVTTVESYPSQLNDLPMHRHIPQPLHAGGLVGRIGSTGADVDLAGDGLVDDGLLLLLQQRD